MKQFRRRHFWGRMAVLSGLFVFGMTDGETFAANQKETPLVNLARDCVDVKDNNGQALEKPELLTDGEKYYLQHSAEGNKVSGSKVEGFQDSLGNKVNEWEAYVEQGAKVSEGAKYVTLDLGASYPIEVINLKRRMYDGESTIQMTQGHSNNPLKYQDTVIVIGNEADLSDGYVVYYNDDDGSVQLPEGVEKPADRATGGLQESMAGTYFYMDNTKENGRGYTELGTTKQARYVRVYSDDPDKDDKLMLTELEVYGYRQAADVQEATKRQVINNENPLMIAAAYSDDQFYLGQKEKVGLQGYNTIAGRWGTVAEDLKDNTVLMMHSNNLRSFSPHYIGQAYIHGYYEECLQEAYEAGAPTMLMLVNASSYPGGTKWCITRDVDYHWADLMFRMYPNLEGVFSTENFWSGSIPKVAESIAEYLTMADRYGGYLVYSEEGTGIFNTLASNQKLRNAVKEHGDSLFFTYKNTAGKNDCLLTQSHIIGSWLAGYTGGWGMLSDSWAWGNNGNGPIYEGRGNYQGWQSLCAEPETIYGMQMINTWLSGGVVYTFEFPEVVYGAIDEKSPAYTHVVEPVFRYICENPGPSRADVLNETKTIIYDSFPSALYAKTVGEDNVLGLFDTGRYGSMPSIPTWGTKDEVTKKVKETAKKEGAMAPVVFSNSDGLFGYGATEYFKSLYPIEYLGDAFAQSYQGKWYMYNSTVNKKVDQTATIPLKGGEGTARFRAEIEPHTYVMMGENGDGSIGISLNNYRIDARELIFKNPHKWKWDGSSATGQGVSNAKLSVYRYMAYYNAVNAKKDVLNLDTPDDLNDRIDQLSPNDNDLRTTTFKITSLSKAPKVEFVKGQEPDTDQKPQYELPVVSYDSQTKTATITVKTNGWIEFKVSDLAYEVDTNAEKIEDSKTEDPGYMNLGAGSGVTVSSPVSSDRPASWAVNKEKSEKNDYTDPGGSLGGAHWISLDMGAQHDVEKVVLYRYFDNRQYYNTVVLLSADENFSPESTLVLWNGNGTNGGKNNQEVSSWPGKGNGSMGDTHSLPQGDQPTYSETKDGKAFSVYDSTVKWLDPNKKEELPKNEEGKNRFQARYVRVYMNGNNQNLNNHVVEIEVFGEAGKVVLEDKIAPEKVTGVEITETLATSATVSFLPSMDNMGMKGYRVSVKKAGETQEVETDIYQTVYELTGLSPNTPYEVTVKAVDNFGNVSEISDTTAFTTRNESDFIVKADKESGWYSEPLTVTLGAALGEGEIYYTLDGAAVFDEAGNPTQTAVQYTSGSQIAIEQSCVLQTALKAYGRVWQTSVYHYKFGEKAVMDFDAPDAPTSVRVGNRAADAATIQWNSSSADVSVFCVYVDGEKKAEVRAQDAVMEATVGGLAPKTAYRVWVTAADEAGNESLRSKTIEFVTRPQ